MSTTPTVPTGHSHYSWDAAGSPVAIHLNYDVIDRVTPEVMKGFMALRRRGAEVGGLLLGHAVERTVTIEDYIPVACEYASGPSYHLSANDLVKLDEAVEAAQGRDLQVVGFYRSHTRPALSTDADDIALFQSYFPSSWAVLLLIRPAATRAGAAGFFLWNGVQLDPAGEPGAEFPFARRELGGGDARAVAAAPKPAVPPPNTKFTFGPPAPEAAAVSAEPPRAAVEPPVPSFLAGAAETSEREPSEQARRRTWLWAPVAIAVCALIGVGLLFWSKTGFPWDEPAGLGLAVAQSDTQIDVTWNRGSSVLAGAKAATLTIQDGAVIRTIDMTPAQLRDGSVRYSRVTGDVMMRLEVESEDGVRTTESVRVLAADGAPARPAELKTERPPESTPPPPAPPPQAAPVAETPKPAETTPVVTQPPDDPEPRRTRRTRRNGKKTEAGETKAAPEAADPTSTLRPGRRK